ncbi:hypothetical protein [Streptomyces sp. NPDC045714]|uniref:hypothetical protein n=1 Tax=Streptomyces sp. NPDC045714 TaxID=3154913 RepID=UPI0033C6DF43
MLEETAAVLAVSGATTPLAAMATRAWDEGRRGALRLPGRGDVAATTERGRRLDADESVVVRSPEADRVGETLVPFWSAQLTMPLVRHPEPADQLRAAPWWRQRARNCRPAAGTGCGTTPRASRDG